jgi:hypothetical protein
LLLGFVVDQIPEIQLVINGPPAKTLHNHWKDATRGYQPTNSSQSFGVCFVQSGMPCSLIDPRLCMLFLTTTTTPLCPTDVFPS